MHFIIPSDAVPATYHGSLIEHHGPCLATPDPTRPGRLCLFLENEVLVGAHASSVTFTAANAYVPGTDDYDKRLDRYRAAMDRGERRIDLDAPARRQHKVTAAEAAECREEIAALLAAASENAPGQQ